MFARISFSALLLQCFDLDGQAVAVPARDIDNSSLTCNGSISLGLSTVLKYALPPQLLTILDVESANDILQDFIQRMPNVQASIRIWGAIMDDKRFPPRALAALPFVEVIGTSLQVFPLVFRQWSWTEEDSAFGPSMEDAKVNGYK